MPCSHCTHGEKRESSPSSQFIFCTKRFFKKRIFLLLALPPPPHPFTLKCHRLAWDAVPPLFRQPAPGSACLLLASMEAVVQGQRISAKGNLCETVLASLPHMTRSSCCWGPTELQLLSNLIAFHCHSLPTFFAEPHTKQTESCNQPWKFRAKGRRLP